MLIGTARCQGVSTKLSNPPHIFPKHPPVKNPLTFPARPQCAMASGDEQGVQSCGLQGTWPLPRIHMTAKAIAWATEEQMG